MKTIVQVVLSLVSAIFFTSVVIDINATNTQTVIADDGYLMSGDVITFSQPQPIMIEAMGDDPFTLIVDDVVVGSTPFAGKHKVETELTVSLIRLVDGGASIQISAPDRKAFEYTYNPGSITARRSILIFLFVWAIINIFSGRILQNMSDD